MWSTRIFVVFTHFCVLSTIAAVVKKSANIGTTSGGGVYKSSNALEAWVTSLNPANTGSRACSAALMSTPQKETACKSFMTSVIKLPKLVQKLNQRYHSVLTGQECLQRRASGQSMEGHLAGNVPGAKVVTGHPRPEKPGKTKSPQKNNYMVAKEIARPKHTSRRRRSLTEASAMLNNDTEETVNIPVVNNKQQAHLISVSGQAPGSSQAMTSDKRPSCTELVDHMKRDNEPSALRKQLDDAWTTWTAQQRAKPRAI